jgi:hypothetical protein
MRRVASEIFSLLPLLQYKSHNTFQPQHKWQSIFLLVASDNQTATGSTTTAAAWYLHHEKRETATWVYTLVCLAHAVHALVAQHL